MSRKSTPKTNVQLNFYDVQNGQKAIATNLRGMSQLIAQDFDNQQDPDNQQDWRVVERPLTTLELIKNTEIVGGVLGKGGFGTVYRAILRLHDSEMPCVVKFSNILMDAQIIRLQQTQKPSSSSIYFNEYVIENRQEAYNTGKRQMMTERNNATSILAPYTRNPWWFDSQDQKMLRLNRQEFMDLKTEVLRIRRHPGYAHIHKIIHFDTNLCCILSEPCDGSLERELKLNFIQAYNQAYPHRSKPMPANWINLQIDHINTKNLILQIGHAIQYLKDVVNICHLDIKPDNIFYTRIQPDNQIQWKLADFGICEPADPDFQKRKRGIGGTLVYLPECVFTALQRQEAYDGIKVMIHCFAITIMEVLCAWYRHYDLDTTDNHINFLCNFYNIVFKNYATHDHGPIVDLADEHCPGIVALLEQCCAPRFNDQFTNHEDHRMIELFDDLINDEIPHAIERQTSGQ